MADFVGTSGDDTLVGTIANDTFFFSLGSDTLFGAEGVDTLIADRFVVSLPSNTVVDLAAGTITAPSLSQTITSIENVTSQRGGGVTLRGNDEDNTLVIVDGNSRSTLEGGGGNDMLFLEKTNGDIFGGSGDDTMGLDAYLIGYATVEGGSGSDTLLILEDQRDVAVNFNTDGQVVLEYGINVFVTLLDEVENFRFADGSVLTFNEFIGPAITGTDAGEVLTGIAGTDRLDALGGDDWILATTGSDTIDGGAGTDMISFVGQDRVVVNLDTGQVLLGNPLAGPREVQQVTNVENITGTSRADNLAGDESYNYIRGLGGADILIGSGGGDLLNGGAGNDLLGINGGLPQMDNHISLLRGRIWEGQGAGTRLVNIENVEGGFLNDHLIGDHGVNKLTGGFGDDILMGNGGDDLIYGGGGQDIAVFGFDQDQYTFTTTGSVTEVAYIGTGAGDGTDLLLTIETLRFADGDVIL